MKGNMTIIFADGRVQTSNGLLCSPSLEVLQTAVGGFIQGIPGMDQYEGEPAIAYCHEEGKILDLPINATATKLWRLLGRVGDRLSGWRRGHPLGGSRLRGSLLLRGGRSHG